MPKYLTLPAWISALTLPQPSAAFALLVEALRFRGP
jgi:hypothetical protein